MDDFDRIQSQFIDLWQEIETDENQKRILHVVELSRILLSWVSHQSKEGISNAAHLKYSSYWAELTELSNKEITEIAQYYGDSKKKFIGKLEKLQVHAEHSKQLTERRHSEIRELSAQIDRSNDEIGIIQKDHDQIEKKLESLKHLQKLVRDTKNMSEECNILKDNLSSNQNTQMIMAILSSLMDSLPKIIQLMQQHFNADQQIQDQLLKISDNADVLMLVTKNLREINHLLQNTESCLTNQIKIQDSIDHDQENQYCG